MRDVRGGRRKLRELVEGAGAWEAVAVVWPDAKALLESRQTAAAFLVAADAGDPAGAALLELLATRPNRTPLLVFGAQPPEAARASLWLPAAPPPGLLAAALQHLVGGTARSARRGAARPT